MQEKERRPQSHMRGVNARRKKQEVSLMQHECSPKSASDDNNNYYYSLLSPQVRLHFTFTTNRADVW